MPKVSIIVPVYNAAKYLRPCLDSVVDQTMPDWECICVDDGSTDASAAILDEYAARDKRFIVVHKANEGVSVARNTALKVARGEWITWLDADDLYATDRLEVAMEIAARENPDLIRFETIFFTSESEIGKKRQNSSASYKVMSDDDAQLWGWRVFAPGGMVWTWIARREILTGIEFPVGMRIKEDSIFCAWIIGRFHKVVQSEYGAYYYRQQESSAMRSLRLTRDCLRLLSEVEKLYHDREYRKPSAVVCAKNRWLRVHAEADIRDWVLQHKSGEDLKPIRSSYLRLKHEGLFAVRSIQRLRYRFPMWWFDKTGQVWMIHLIDRLIRLMRNILK